MSLPPINLTTPFTVQKQDKLRAECPDAVFYRVPEPPPFAPNIKPFLAPPLQKLKRRLKGSGFALQDIVKLSQRDNIMELEELYLHQSLFAALPCGKFELTLDNITICSGYFELIEAHNDEPQVEISLKDLSHCLYDDWTLKLRLPKHMPTPPELMLKVRRDAVIARYTYLSRYVEELLQGFNLGGPYPAVLVQCQKGEKWPQACLRSHLEVLHLVAKQCAAMKATQLKALKAGAVTVPKTVTTAQELLGAPQPPSLIMAARRCGFLRHLIRMLPRTQEGLYGRALLVSSRRHFETLCVLPTGELNKFYPKGRSFDGIDTRLPIWSPRDRIAELTVAGFKWRAVGESELRDEVLAPIGTLYYGLRGLASGVFELFNNDFATSEEGNLSDGCLPSSLRLVFYQNYRDKFPAAFFTVDLLSGEFEGEFSLVYDIATLFDQGYHAIMLLPASTTTYTLTGEPLPPKKRLAPYKPSTFLAITGQYASGELKKEQKHQLEPYRSQHYWHNFFW